MRVITINTEQKQINTENINPNELNSFVDSFVQGTSIRLMIDDFSHCIFINRDAVKYEPATGFYFIDKLLSQPIFGNAVIVQYNGDYISCEVDVSQIAEHVVFLTESQARCAMNHYYYL